MVKIQPASMHDKPRLAALFKQLAYEPSIMNQLEKQLEQVLTHPEYRLVVARDQSGKAIGTAMGTVCYDLVGESRPFMLIENVVVDKIERGKGIGRSLMQDLENHAREKGCSYIMFVTGAEQEDAYHFYSSMGYKLSRARGFKKIL